MRFTHRSLVCAVLAFAGCASGMTGSVEHTDPALDAGPSWLDLTSTKVRGRGRTIEVTWTLAAPLPKGGVKGPGLDLTVEARTIDYTRYEIVAHRVGTSRRQTLLRFLGPGPGQGDRAVKERPRIEKRQVVVRVPLSAMPRLETPFTWTSSSYSPEPPAGDGIPQVQNGQRRRIVFPKSAKIPSGPPAPPRVQATQPLGAEFDLQPPGTAATEIWLRNGGELDWRNCWVYLNDETAAGTGFGRKLAHVAPGDRVYLHRFSFLQKRTILPTSVPLDSVTVLCETPRGWGLEVDRLEGAEREPGSTAL